MADEKDKDKGKKPEEKTTARVKEEAEREVNDDWDKSPRKGSDPGKL